MTDEFAGRLRQERKRLGRNQADFGRLGGVTLATQSRYELGTSVPDAHYLAQIAGVGVDVQFVLTGARVVGDYVGPDEAELIRRYRLLTPNAQTAFRYLAGSQQGTKTGRLAELPSEDALARMFQAMLLPLDLGGALEETARTFAQQLPASLDAAGPGHPQQYPATTPALDTQSPASAKPHPASEPTPRT